MSSRVEFESVFQDENRFATKGAHLNLKRAEKARAAIAKLPGIDHCCLRLDLTSEYSVRA